jgi:hypothetical protein
VELQPHSTDAPGVARVHAPLAPLLDIAAARLRRQKAYAQPLSKGGPGATVIDDILQKARACITDLAAPQNVLIPVQAEAAAGTVHLAGHVTPVDADLAGAVVNGAAVTIYLLTLGYEQARAFEWLAGDYAAHHVVSDLSSEVLFAYSRRVFRAQKAALSPGTQLKRISIRTDAACGRYRIWDAAKVQALLKVLGEQNIGVRVTETGCFQPLQSLLGLTMATGHQTGIGSSQRLGFGSSMLA